jgi:hypothetical protein
MAEAALLPESDVKDDRPLLVHIMHDIETFSTQNNPVIPALGAVKFTREGVVDRFEIGIDPSDCQRYGLHIDAGTVLWWMDPARDEARKYLLELGKIDLFAALDGYAMWIDQTPKESLGSMWANGATFDHVKLRSAYDACKIDVPWHYRAEECYRTISNRFKDIPFQRQGLHHGALDDAVSQAFHLVEIDKAHGLGL